MKICPRLLIFELSDSTLGIFRGYDFSIFPNCYFWIDILRFLTQTFEPAPGLFSYGVSPLGFSIRCRISHALPWSYLTSISVYPVVYEHKQGIFRHRDVYQKMNFGHIVILRCASVFVNMNSNSLAAAIADLPEIVS